jgi:predicted RNA-binding Zn ribbon-like protein
MRPVDAIADPGGREPAPGRLRLVQAFVNTVDFEHGREVLADPARLERHLHELGLDPGRISTADLEKARVLRESLRRLALANNGVDPDVRSLATLEQAARAARLTVRFGADGRSELVPQAGGIDGTLGTLVAIVYAAMERGAWPRLKACRRDVCHWIFWDASRNRSGTWCHMTVCGNRTKTKAYRRRRAATSG